jgi:hypothetical protein
MPCPCHTILFHIHTIKLFGEEYKLCSFSLCRFLHPPVTLPLVGPNILLRTLFSNTLNLCSSLNVRNQVSHPYKTTGKIIVLCSPISILRFWIADGKTPEFRLLSISSWMWFWFVNSHSKIIELCHIFKWFISYLFRNSGTFIFKVHFHTLDRNYFRTETSGMVRGNWRPFPHFLLLLPSCI